MKKLFLRDGLTIDEYETLHNHLTSDEYHLLLSSSSDSFNKDNLWISAHETASHILRTETLENLLEYDLMHILNNDTLNEPIVLKIETAVKKEKEL